MTTPNLSLTSIKLGDSATPANNFIISVPDIPDGTLTIERGDGTDVLTIDAAGKVVMPGNIVPAFRAYASGSGAIVNVGANTKIVLNTIDWDTTLAFDTGGATSRYTPKVAGYYQFNGSLRVTTASYAIDAYLYKSGVLTATSDSSTAPSRVATVQDLIYMNGTTDYVELFGYSATAQNSSSDKWGTYLSGYLVRAA